MKLYEILNESMSLGAVVLDISSEKYPKGIYRSVFPAQDSEPYDYSRTYDMEYKGPAQNPEWNPDFEVNLSNSNMEYILGEVLGFDNRGDSGYTIPIEQFINITRNWLRSRIDKQSKAEPTVVSKQPGKATVYQLGRRTGYENDIILKMNRVAQLGKQRGATHISAY